MCHIELKGVERIWTILGLRLDLSDMICMALVIILEHCLRVIVSLLSPCFSSLSSLLHGSMALITDTAFVKDAKGWKFAEDSRISKAQEKDIVVSTPFTLMRRDKS